MKSQTRLTEFSVTETQLHERRVCERSVLFPSNTHLCDSGLIKSVRPRRLQSIIIPYSVSLFLMSFLQVCFCLSCDILSSRPLFLISSLTRIFHLISRLLFSSFLSLISGNEFNFERVLIFLPLRW